MGSVLHRRCWNRFTCKVQRSICKVCSWWCRLILKVKISFKESKQVKGKNRKRGKFSQWPAWKGSGGISQTSLLLCVSFPMQQVFPVTLSHSNSVVFMRTCSSSLFLLMMLVVLHQGRCWMLLIELCACTLLGSVMYTKSYRQEIGKGQRREGLRYSVDTTLSTYWYLQVKGLENNSTGRTAREKYS